MDRDRHITAMFHQEACCRVTVSVLGPGNVSPPSGAYPVASHHEISLEAFPEQDAHFGGWRVRDGHDVVRALLENPLTLPVADDIAVEAYFSERAHELLIETSHDGAILTPPVGRHGAAEGALVDLYAVAPEGKEFYYWEGALGRRVSDDAAFRITVSAFQPYRAVFGPPRSRLHWETAGEGSGKVVAPFEQAPWLFPPDHEVELRAQAAADAVFARWEGDIPKTMDAETPVLRVQMDRDRQVIAVFDKADYQVSILVEGLEEETQAVISPAPGIYGVRADTAFPVVAWPKSGLELAFVGWHGAVASPNPQATLRVDRDLEMVARFAHPDATDAVRLTVLSSEGAGNARFQPLEPGEYYFQRGARMDLSLQLEDNAFFAGWTGAHEEHVNYKQLPLILDADRIVGAKTADRGGVLVLQVDHSAGGVTNPPPGVYRFAAGMDVPLQALRTDTAFSFEGWFNPVGGCYSTYGRYVYTMPEHNAYTVILARFRHHGQLPRLQLCRAGDLLNRVGIDQ